MPNQSLVPESKQGLAKFKNEVASTMNVPFSDYNGNLQIIMETLLLNNVVALVEKWLREW